MKNYKLKLPKGLCSVEGNQPKVNFEMSRRHYEINGEQFDNPLKDKLNVDFQGYTSYIMNDFILITLFYKNDILTPI